MRYDRHFCIVVSQLKFSRVDFDILKAAKGIKY